MMVDSNSRLDELQAGLLRVKLSHLDEFNAELCGIAERYYHEIANPLIHYPIPPHLSEAYAYLGYQRGDFPIAEQYADEVLSLPMYNGMTHDEQTTVIEAINEFEV